MRKQSKATHDGLGSAGASETATMDSVETLGPLENVPNLSRCFVLSVIIFFFFVNMLSLNKKFDSYFFLTSNM